MLNEELPRPAPMETSTLEFQRKDTSNVIELKVSRIRFSRFELRHELSDIQDLARSIDEKGLLQPIIARNARDGTYEVVSGNRRLVAVRELRWKTIPCLLMQLDDRESFEILLTENVQKQTFSPLDEARAFYAYVGPKEKNCFNYGKISELARRIGKSQEYVSNRIRLLRLPESFLNEMLKQRDFKISHAEELASLSEKPEAIHELHGLMKKRKVTVRELERAIPLIKSGVDAGRAVEQARYEVDLKVEWDYRKDKGDLVCLQIKKSKNMLESMLAYLDSTGPDFEHDKELHDYWISNVRLRVHDAINGIIMCHKMHASLHDHAIESPDSQRKPLPSVTA